MFIFCVITNTSPILLNFFHNFQTILFKIFDTLRKLPLPLYVMLKKEPTPCSCSSTQTILSLDSIAAGGRGLIITEHN